jgi:hypothetical protein
MTSRAEHGTDSQKRTATDQSKPEPVWRSYSDVREEIRDGDILLFRGASWYSRFIELASHGVHSHSGFSLDWGERKMLMSAVATGVHTVPLSTAIARYSGRVDLYKLTPAARADVDFDKLHREAKADLELRFSLFGLMMLGLHMVLRTRAPKQRGHPNALFCSQYVCRCFRVAELRFVSVPDNQCSPEEIEKSTHLKYAASIRPPKKNQRLDEMTSRRARLRAG